MQFKLKYIDRIKVEEEKGIEAFLGDMVHRALQRLYEYLRDSKLLTLDETINIYNQEWDKNWNDNIVIRKKGITSQNYKDTGIKCLTNYYSRYTPFNQAITIWVEERVDFPLTSDGKYKVGGRIDRVDRIKDGVYEIHDYKTSAHLPSKEVHDEDRQLALYEIGIKKRLPDVKEVKLIWHYLRHDMEVTSTRTPEQVEELKRETIALIDTIENDKEFKYKESPLCDWCDYPEYCPAKKHIIKVDSLPANEYLKDNGVKLVNKYAAVWKQFKEVEAERDKIKDALAAYAKRMSIETIKGSDHTVKVTFKKRKGFPKKDSSGRKELERIIRDAGLWDQVSELDSDTLSKLLDSKKWDKELIEKILEFVIIEESPTVNKPRMIRKEE